MSDFDRTFPTTRRRVLQLLALFGLGSAALARSARALAESAARAGDAWPEMTYRTLGRTGFRGSRLVFGCGAALSSGRRDDLLNEAFDHGVNVFDVGTRTYYRDAEANLAAFAKARRDRIFLISKGLVRMDVSPADALRAAQCRIAAQNWTSELERSLAELRTDHVDAYYVMAANNVSLIRSEEMHAAFETARKAGKVDHWGVSTHENARAVLEAAADTGWYSLAQIAITPAGWYDWRSKSVLRDSGPMVDLRAPLDRARAAGMGLVGMKAARYLSGGFFGSRAKTFDAHYGETLRQASFSPFQRSYAFVLAHGLDAVNADSQSPGHLRENFVAAATSDRYFGGSGRS